MFTSLKLFALSCLISTQLVGLSWNQYRANDLNNGFIPVQTSPAETPAWSLELDFINGTCPVIGADGTIYVANTRGTLYAISPSGVLLWKKELRRGWACSTPTVDSNGNIYVHCTFRGYSTDHRGDKPPQRRFIQQSQVFCCSSSGGIRWTYTPPTITLPNGDRSSFFFTSTPKIWEQNGETHIFLVESYWTDNLIQRNFLIALNDSGQLVDARFLSEAAFGEITGGGGFSLKSGSVGPIPLPSGSFKPENAIGILNFSDQAPIIIVNDVADAITAIEWRGNWFSTILWKKPPSSTIFKYFVTSPSIHYAGIVIFGRSDGKIFLLDPWTGIELHKPLSLDSGIYSTPASFLRQFYLITHDGDFVTFDSDGTLLTKTPVGAESYSSPAFSASHLFVIAANGIYTFNFAGEKLAFFKFNGGGNSSPAIDANGFVYALSATTLYAFDPSP